MISLEDMVAMSGLTEEEILAIAEHEHVEEPVAACIAAYLAGSTEGLHDVCSMIIDDIRNAQAADDEARLRELLHVLHHFLRTHPEAAPQVHPWSRLS